jgi:parallel beta-helix repeat protein
MKGSHFGKKSLAVGIILLFIGTAIIPSSGQNIEKQSLPTFTGKTIYVNCNNTQGPWDGTLEHPYRTIQDGVNASKNGDTVFVFEGNYTSAIINNTINLVGEQMNRTIINISIIVRANNVNISEFTFYNTTADMWHGMALILNGEGCKITHNYFDFSGVYGIKVNGGYHVIENNFFTHLQETAIWLDCNNNELRGNSFFDNVWGIEMGGNKNIIENNNFSGQKFSGILCGGGGLIANNNQIRNNIFFCNHEGGITMDAGGHKIHYNNFIRNTPNVIIEFDLPHLHNNWNYNYWDDSNGKTPYVIKGTWTYFALFLSILYMIIHPGGYGGIIEFTLPWINVDWHPAKKPYNISGMS